MAYAALLVASVLATSACASSHSAGANPTTATTTKTDAILLHETGYNALAAPIQRFVQSTIKAGTPDGPIHEIDVYGPGSRAALVKASSGDVVVESPREHKEAFYLFVYRGRFVCADCTGPASAKPPHGTIETRVWSPVAGGTDFGFGHTVPAAVSRLHRLATITLS